MREAYVYTCPDFQNGQLDTAISMFAQNGTWKYVLRERIQEYVGDFTGLIYVMEVQWYHVSRRQYIMVSYNIMS